MKIKIRLFPKVTGTRHYFKVQGNVFALVQIFNAIPSPSFSAPAELRMINLNHWFLSYVNPSLKLWNCRAQYILGVRPGRIPSQDGFGRLNLQCRSDISPHLYNNFFLVILRQAKNEISIQSAVNIRSERWKK